MHEFARLPCSSLAIWFESLTDVLKCLAQLCPPSSAGRLGRLELLVMRMKSCGAIHPHAPALLRSFSRCCEGDPIA